jgi:hypothetical protein
VRQDVSSVLKAEHVAGPLRGIVGTAQIPAVLTSGVSYVSSSQIMSELDCQAIEAIYGRGK